MLLTLQPDIAPLPQPISYTDKILLIGSCFTEHMAERLAQHKFKILSNPNGILFNPLSVADSLRRYISGKAYEEKDLFLLNELWNSWDHHTRFSDVDPTTALQKINQSHEEASGFVREADWVVITLGSAFQYYLKEHEQPVANNHRAPAQWFEKRLLGIELIVSSLTATLKAVWAVNPEAKFLFTISPVRHIRDGVVDNNRSKARLIDAVHELCQQFDQAYYFPAYELIIDILRDYRFYDVDFVHPNYLATQFVWEHFVSSCIAPQAGKIMEQVQDIVTARSHRPRFPETDAHRKFTASYRAKIEALSRQYPFLDLDEERRYFSS